MIHTLYLLKFHFNVVIIPMCAWVFKMCLPSRFWDFFVCFLLCLVIFDLITVINLVEELNLCSFSLSINLHNHKKLWIVIIIILNRMKKIISWLWLRCVSVAEKWPNYEHNSHTWLQRPAGRKRSRARSEYQVFKCVDKVIFCVRYSMLWFLNILLYMTKLDIIF